MAAVVAILPKSLSKQIQCREVKGERPQGNHQQMMAMVWRVENPGWRGWPGLVNARAESESSRYADTVSHQGKRGEESKRQSGPGG